MGSETSGGSVYVLNFVNPVDSNPSTSIIWQRMHEVASFNCTIWTADYNSIANQAVIGKFFPFLLICLYNVSPIFIFHIIFYVIMLNQPFCILSYASYLLSKANLITLVNRLRAESQVSSDII